MGHWNKMSQYSLYDYLLAVNQFSLYRLANLCKYTEILQCPYHLL